MAASFLSVAGFPQKIQRSSHGVDDEDDIPPGEIRSGQFIWTEDGWSILNGGGRSSSKESHLQEAVSK